MKKIVFFNTKGGTGKTTVCYNYGWYLAEKKKKKVLFMDFDPQVNLVQSFDLGTSNSKGKNLDRLITDYARGRRTSFEKYIIEVNSKIHLLPSSNNISLIEEYLTDAIIEKSKESRDSVGLSKVREMTRGFNLNMSKQVRALREEESGARE